MASKKVLEGKVAVVTGASRGLGLAIAKALAESGAAVCIGSRSAEATARAVASLVAGGARAVGRACDVSDPEAVEALADLAESSLGPIDFWVNNAGLSAPYGPTAHLPIGALRAVVDTNIAGTMNGSVVALRRFLPRAGGKLVNLLGRGDDGAIPLQNLYSSSKVWVRNFTRALAKEYAGSGVGIFAFNPGLVDTDMLRRVDVVAGYEAKVKPLETVIRLWGNQPDRPAQKALWLASAATDGKTGLSVRLLSPTQAMMGLLRDGVRRLTGQSAPDTALDVRPVPPNRDFVPPR